MWLYVHTPTAEEQAGLEALARSSNTVTFRRARTVLLSAQGRKVPEIMEALGLSDRTVRATIRRFNERGLAAIPRGKAPGKPRSLAPAAREALVELLHRPQRSSASRARCGRPPSWPRWPCSRVRPPRCPGTRYAPRSGGRARVGSGPSAGRYAATPNTPEKGAHPALEGARACQPGVGAGVSWTRPGSSSCLPKRS